MRFDPSPEPLFWLIRALPDWAVRWLARAIGSMLYTLLGSRRRLMFENLNRAFPEMSGKEKKRIAKASWTNLVLTACEFVRFPTHLKSMLGNFSCEGLENLQAAYDKGKGVLLYGPHMGNWELSAAFMASHFTFSAIGRPLKQSKIDGAVKQLRESVGITLYDRKNALRGILSALRRGDVTAFLFDQHAGKNGVEVLFFGHPVSAFSSVAHLARKTGAPAALAYPYRREDGGVHLVMCKESPLTDTGDVERDAITNTQNYISAMEDAIRAHPESWMWMHRRWRK